MALIDIKKIQFNYFQLLVQYKIPFAVLLYYPSISSHNSYRGDAAGRPPGRSASAGRAKAAAPACPGWTRFPASQWALRASCGRRRPGCGRCRGADRTIPPPAGHTRAACAGRRRRRSAPRAQRAASTASGRRSPPGRCRAPGFRQGSWSWCSCRRRWGRCIRPTRPAQSGGSHRPARRASGARAGIRRPLRRASPAAAWRCGRSYAAFPLRSAWMCLQNLVVEWVKARGAGAVGAVAGGVHGKIDAGKSAGQFRWDVPRLAPPHVDHLAIGKLEWEVVPLGLGAHLQLDRAIRDADCLCLGDQGADAAPQDRHSPPQALADRQVAVVALVHVDGQPGLVALALRLKVEQGGCGAGQVLLPASHESMGCHIAERGRDAVEGQPARPLWKRPGARVQVAAEVPLQTQCSVVEVIPPAGEGHLLRRDAIGLDLQAHRRVDDWPAVVAPVHWGEVGLAADVVHLRIANVAAGQEDDPPPPRGVFDEVAVSGRLDGPIEAAVGKDRIVRAGLVGAVDVAAAGDGDHVAEFGAAFGQQEVVPAVALDDVRGLGIGPAGPAPQVHGLADQLSRGNIDGRLECALEAVVVLGAIADEVGLAIVIKEEGRVDARLVHPDGLGPFTGRVFCPHIEVAAMAYIGDDHVEPAGVVADGGGVDAAGTAGLIEGQLAVAGEAMADWLPVHQVAAVEDRHAREVFEAAGHEVVVLTHATDWGIGMESRDDWVGIGHNDALLWQRELSASAEEGQPVGHWLANRPVAAQSPAWFHTMPIMRKWLGRLAYSLVIIGGVLFYQVYRWQTSSERIPGWQATVIVIGGAACIALGMQGIRYRNQALRRDGWEEQHGDRD